MKQNEIVLITGASAGVGRATAVAFAQRGAKIGLLARGHKGLEGTKKEVKLAGGEAIMIPVDVSDYYAISKAADTIERTFGPIDIWVNCAMTTVFAEFMDIEPQEFKRVTEVTYLGYVYGTNAALKRMIPRNRGTIMQVSSVLAFRSIPLQSAYCGAKHGIVGFTNSIRSELLHNRSKVKITMVHLPAVNTPQFDWCKNRMPRKSQPVPPIYQPELIAENIYWAAHHYRRDLVLGLNASIIVWGNKFFPGFGDWYLAKTGYNSQQYNGPTKPNQPDNLFKTIDSNPGTRGSFSRRAVSKSLHMDFIKLPFLSPIVNFVAVVLVSFLIGIMNRKRKCLV